MKPILIPNNEFLQNFPDHIVQYLMDNPEMKRDAKPVLRNKLDVKEAQEMQKKGFGVYISANGFQSGSRKRKDLTILNAISIDKDIAKESQKLKEKDRNSLKEVAFENLIGIPYPPHIIIETKNGLQGIWLLANDISIEEAETAQENLIEFLQADMGAKDITRLIRMPYFFHLKDPKNPFQCNLVNYRPNTARYGINEIIDMCVSESEYNELASIPLQNVIQELVKETGILISFRDNPDGSKQIIENGEVTSGFISSKGNFIYSASGKSRKGNAVSIVKYYLNIADKKAYNWIQSHFAFKEGIFDFHDYEDFNPSLHFSNDKVYIGIKLRNNADGKIKEKTYLITSEREKILFDDNFTASHGYFSDKRPNTPQRWETKSIKSFLQNEDCVTFDSLIDEIVSLLKNYIDFDLEIAYFIVAVWIVGTYFHTLFNTFPYLSITGNPGCGKTKLLEILSLLSFNGELSNSTSTPASTKRLIHDNSSTCCVDEVESLRKIKDENSKTLLAMYNGGYKKGQPISIAESKGKGSEFIVRRFDCYSPKAFAGINGLDITLASRCIPITMIRSSNPTILNADINNTDAVWKKIRNNLYLFVMHYWQDVRASYESINDTEIVGRDWELWKPLLAITQIIVPDKYELIREYANESNEEKQDTYSEELPTERILRMFEKYFKEKNLEITIHNASEIKDMLIEYDSESFSWIETRYKRPGRWIGNELRKAGILAKLPTSKRGREGVSKVFEIHANTVKERLKAFP